jgi:hypothetical protein
VYRFLSINKNISNTIEVLLFEITKAIVMTLLKG